MGTDRRLVSADFCVDSGQSRYKPRHSNFQSRRAQNLRVRSSVRCGKYVIQGCGIQHALAPLEQLLIIG